MGASTFEGCVRMTQAAIKHTPRLRFDTVVIVVHTFVSNRRMITVKGMRAPRVRCLELYSGAENAYIIRGNSEKNKQTGACVCVCVCVRGGLLPLKPLLRLARSQTISLVHRLDSIDEWKNSFPPSQHTHTHTYKQCCVVYTSVQCPTGSLHLTFPAEPCTCAPDRSSGSLR